MTYSWEIPNFVQDWNAKDLDVDYLPSGVVEQWNPQVDPERAHIALFNTLRKLDGEKDVVIMHPSSEAQLAGVIKKEFPRAEIIFSRLMQKDKILVTKKKNLKPPIRWR